MRYKLNVKYFDMCFLSQCLQHDGPRQHFAFSPLLPSNESCPCIVRMSARVHGSRLLSLATTVSALHRNARIWNASHPVLVTYYCRVTVYSPGLEAKKDILRGGCMLPPEFETGSAGVVIQASAIYAMRTVVPNDSYCTRNQKCRFI